MIQIFHPIELRDSIANCRILLKSVNSQYFLKNTVYSNYSLSVDKIFAGIMFVDKMARQND